MTYVCNEGACNYMTHDRNDYMRHMVEEHEYSILEAAELAKDIRSINDD